MLSLTREKEQTAVRPHKRQNHLNWDAIHPIRKRGNWFNECPLRGRGRLVYKEFPWKYQKASLRNYGI